MIPAAIIDDWKLQDGTDYDAAIAKIKSTDPQMADRITGSGEAGYLQACHWRRVARMKPFTEWLRHVVVAKHHDIGGPIVGYTEDLQGDGVGGIGSYGFPGASRSSDYGSGGNSGIYSVDFTDYYPSRKPLVEDAVGVLRDPCPNLDGTRVVYAHAKDNDGYHICDVDIATKVTRQLTDDLGSIHVSDFEPCVTERDEIIFNSSRCFSQVAANINIVSNLYVMDCDGRYLRRLSCDLLHTFSPTLMDDGSIMYSRWEYNDRNCANNLGIFSMGSDGSHQQQWFGNRTSWPATFPQARSIPRTGGRKALAVIGGHQGPYSGDLVFVDATRGQNNDESVVCTRLIAPVRDFPGLNSFDMNGVPPIDKKYQNPYPLDEEHFLISFRRTTEEKFSVYFMDTAGHRELIAWDSLKSVSQPVSLRPRTRLPFTAPEVDYRKNTAVLAVCNAYYVTAIPGHDAAVKKIRVVGLEACTDPAIGRAGAQSAYLTPVGRFGATTSAKWIIGEASVNPNGSSSFTVPPNVPLFIQLIDSAGICLQTMRSWVSLRPGEKYVCGGCHESGDVPPVRSDVSLDALLNDVRPLDSLYGMSGAPGSFYFPDDIQPVLGANCVKSGCHDATHDKLVLTDSRLWTNDLEDADNNECFRYWNTSYYNLSRAGYVSCNAVFGSAGPIPAYSVGSAKSGVIRKLQDGHVKNLPADVIPKLAAWIDLGIPHSGTYTDDMRPEDRALYLERLDRRNQEEAFEKRNVEAWVHSQEYAMWRGDYAGTGSPAERRLLTVRNITARFSRTGSRLSLSLPAAGVIRIFDVSGRLLVTETVTEDAFRNCSTVHFVKKFSSGMYLLHFKGAGMHSVATAFTVL